METYSGFLGLFGWVSFRSFSFRRRLRDVYSRIAFVYERFNRLVTLGLVDRWRYSVFVFAVRCLGKGLLPRVLRILDAGSGPGYMGRFFRALGGSAYIVALDFSYRMISLNSYADDLVVGVLENLPFRDGAFDIAVAGYSIHASADIPSVFRELSRVSSILGAVSIGRSLNPLKRISTLLYSWIMIPLASMIAGYRRGVHRDLMTLLKIVVEVPPNRDLQETIERYIDICFFDERALGSIYILAGYSRHRRRGRLASSISSVKQ